MEESLEQPAGDGTLTGFWFLSGLPPGLRAARYPGCVRRNKPSTLKGLPRCPDRSILTAMPQSLARILVHTVFSTKDRRRLLHDTALRQELHHYMGGILKHLDCQPIIVGGVDSGPRNGMH
jgi:hypothetical protein